MVTRRERTKHSICKLQEQIFHLQMKLMEQDLCRGRPGTSLLGRRVCGAWKGLGTSASPFSPPLQSSGPCETPSRPWLC